LSWDIVDAMSTVKELVLSPDGTVAELAAGDEDVAGAVVAGADALDDVDEVEEFVDDEQPAAAKAAIAARATQLSRGRGLNVPWPCAREGHSPCLLCIAIATPPLG
jgi:hypothetical protein